MTHVEICGIGFSGTHIPELNLVYTKLRDWDGRASARGGGDSIPGGQGVFGRTQELRESIVVTVEAAIIADSTDEYFAVKRRIENMPFLGEMRVDQGDGVWVRQVEVQQVNIPDAHTKTFTAFTIDLVAPDPVRYRDLLTVGPVGLPTRSGGLRLPKAFPWNFGTESREVATVVNDGSVLVLPRMVVTGSAASITVRGGPYRLEFGTFDGELVLDSLERRAWLNGTEVTRDLIRRDWPLVAPGVTAEFSFEAVSPSPDINLLVEYLIGVW